MNGFCNAEPNPLGPDQVHVVPAVTSLAVRNKVSPVQTGELLVAVGVSGVLSITTFTNALSVQPLKVAFTQYIPENAVIALGLEGSDSVDENPTGPVHNHVSPTESGLENRFSVLPEHIGALLVALIIGKGLSITWARAVSLAPLRVRIT
jgi:hypothetical protein